MNLAEIGLVFEREIRARQPSHLPSFQQPPWQHIIHTQTHKTQRVLQSNQTFDKPRAHALLFMSMYTKTRHQTIIIFAYQTFSPTDDDESAGRLTQVPSLREGSVKAVLDVLCIYCMYVAYAVNVSSLLHYCDCACKMRQTHCLIFDHEI